MNPKGVSQLIDYLYVVHITISDGPARNCLRPFIAQSCHHRIPSRFSHIIGTIHVKNPESILGFVITTFANPMNSSLVNNSSPACPSFVEGVQNLTISYCGLAACANNTAVMSTCCNGAKVNLYHYNSNFPGADASGDAFWCAVANASISIWLDCVAEHGLNNSMAFCAGESKSKTSTASVGGRQKLRWTFGLVGLVVLVQGML